MSPKEKLADETHAAWLAMLLRRGALKFGSFRTKSGRESPYFMNLGVINSGPALAQTALLYAQHAVSAFGPVDNLFGPAYKGIPLAASVSEKLSDKTGHEVTFTFNRKEAKDHGEAGNLVGWQYGGGERVLIVEDVLTGGTSVRESLGLLSGAGVQAVGVLVGIDRQERGTGAQSAAEEIRSRYGVPVHAILNVEEITGFLAGRTFDGRVWIDDETAERISCYRAEYGA